MNWQHPSHDIYQFPFFRNINGWNSQFMRDKVQDEMFLKTCEKYGINPFRKDLRVHAIRYVIYQNLLKMTNEDSIWTKLWKEEDYEYIHWNMLLFIPVHFKTKTFFNEAKYFNEKGSVFVQGDFNARTACQSNNIKQDKPDFIISDSWCQLNLE